jgi:glutamate formiminotransferase/formiminotetrahydrofolate cyclodeaminase
MMALNFYCFFRERIIEYCLPSHDGNLARQTVKEFVMNVAARSPAPGGGSVSALLGALVI